MRVFAVFFSSSPLFLCTCLSLHEHTCIIYCVFSPCVSSAMCGIRFPLMWGFNKKLHNERMFNSLCRVSTCLCGILFSQKNRIKKKKKQPPAHAVKKHTYLTLDGILNTVCKINISGGVIVIALRSWPDRT